MSAPTAPLSARNPLYDVLIGLIAPAVLLQGLQAHQPPKRTCRPNPTPPCPG